MMMFECQDAKSIVKFKKNTSNIPSKQNQHNYEIFFKFHSNTISYK